MNRTKIEFADYTWNPIVGCRISCWYCYARRLHLRFFGDSFGHPVFHPDRLKLPGQYRMPQRIFVCSMGDIFSDGVSPEWIQAVLQVVRENPQHTFQFLTKRPENYRNYDFPSNAWLGTTVDHRDNAGRIHDLLSCGCRYITFVLVEPLLSDMDGIDFTAIDFLWVGAMTGPGAIVPQPEWIDSIVHPNIKWKSNIQKFLQK